ncbi:lytic transglycosylase domain-containing protein [Microbacterium sp. zg.B48]|uniref:aggregation-promoting factor C-terminal-like domain-containing protein n=1 Tax=Microbacterium sp. zg.B48 TaxID=2969408 RepID=UPI00214AD5F0|nr:lytic transglycosylase domain-containing protein [Microbacterium sp. zg.B48]MCR2763694.1 lytic transglycosylase domain-containing protein [Microbacterium sp. zg.B48]
MTSGNEMIPARGMPRQDAATLDTAAVAVASHRRSPTTPRWSRRRGVAGVFAAFAVIGFAAAYIGPTGVALTEARAQEPIPVTLYSSTLDDAQRLLLAREAGEQAAADLDRAGYTVYVTPKPTPTPEPVVAANDDAEESSSSGWRPPFVTPDPGTAQGIAYEMVLARGWGDDQFACLVALWNRESGWRVNAYNSGSGAYGIPQALPGNKMASAGADWETNPATQISWGLGYIGGRYGSPCGAWDHSERVGWY